MKNKLLAISMLLMLAITVLPILGVNAAEVTLTLSDAELGTQFAKSWGPASVIITDISGPGVQFNFTGLSSSGTGVSDGFTVSGFAGGAYKDYGYGFAGPYDFRAYTQYRLIFTNIGPNPVTVNLLINTGWTSDWSGGKWKGQDGYGASSVRDTFWQNSWIYVAPGKSVVVTLDFSSAICWNAQDDQVAEWRYPGGTSGVIVRRLDEVSRIGFEVLGNGAGLIVVSATTPSDTVLSLSDAEMSTQFAKETGPATLTAITDVPGPGVRFDFTGLSSSTGTVVGDNFPVSGLAGGAWKDYGSGFAGPYNFSGYARYILLFTNVGTTTVKVNLKINTGWTASPWGTPERDTFWQNSWTTIPPGESRIVTLDFWSAEVWHAGDDPNPAWQYSDGTTGVIVRRLDEVSDIGFQILGSSDGSVVVSGELILSLSDAELSAQFAKETGPGTLTAVTDIPGPGVKFDFTGLKTDVGTVVGDNFPVSSLAGGTYKTYGVNQTFSTWGDFSGYTKYRMIFTNVGPNPVTVNLKVNTGWTIPPPEYAKAWRDTYWQDTWTYIEKGKSQVVTLDFSSAQVWHAGDEQEYKNYSDGTTGVAVWRLDEVSDIGFQVLANGAASIIVSAITPTAPQYWKPEYPDYAPSGVPDFDQRQDAWNVGGFWSWCAPTAVANSLWWMDSRYETSTTAPPTINDTFPLVSPYGLWDDHDPNNVVPFITHLAFLMDTDGIRTGIPHTGTNVFDMQAGIAQYLSWTGLNPLGDVNGDGTVDQTDLNIVSAAMGSSPGVGPWNMAADIWPETVTGPYTADNFIDSNDLNLVTANLGKTGMFYEQTVPAPSFYFVEEEVERCEDVVLVLGFWTNETGTWMREYYPYDVGSGHVVTVAGVNSTALQIAISDPIQDNAEAGGLGRVLPPGIPHNHPPVPPDTTHNNASFVSHDVYNVAGVPPGFALVSYASPQFPCMIAVVEWAVTVSPIVKPPVAYFDYSPLSPKAGDTVTFNATLSTPNGGTIQWYYWNFNDTTTANETDPITTHAFASPGTYNVTLTIGDDQGFTDTTWRLVTVVSAVKHDISIISVTTNKQYAHPGRIVNITVVVKNNGDVSETFNVTAKRDSIPIGTILVTNLGAGDNTTLIFQWDTSGLTRCTTWTIKAEAPLAGDANPGDNTLTDGTVKITMLVDINEDGVVDIEDIVICAVAFGSKPGSPKWDPRADLNGDNLVDIFDIVSIAIEYGKKCKSA